MGRLGALCTILFFVFLDIGAGKDDCPPSRCSPDGPEIRFPFRRSDYPEHCGYPGFELACQGNDTVIKLPSSGVFPIASIYYGFQMLFLESKVCPASLLLNVDVSNSPFRASLLLNVDVSNSPFRFYTNGLEDVIGDFIFLNCSIADSFTATNSRYDYFDYYDEIDCLSESDNRIFLVRPSSNLANLPKYCTPIKTIQWSLWRWPYATFTIRDPILTWERPDCAHCETGGGTCQPHNSTSHEIMCSYQPQPNPLPQLNPPPDHDHRGVCKKCLIIGAVLSTLVLLVTTAISIKVCHSWLLKREKEKESQLKVEKFLEDYKALKPMRYSYADIKKITNQFKTKLGEGGYGSVFKGFLPNGVPVAVKILLGSIGSNGEDFVNEVGTIGRIHHVNVVRLLGFCADGFKRALIYEFMPNESLAKFIFSVDGRSTWLGWDRLHNIAIGIARGIEYLHQGCDQRILHFDIKPHNVLLDDNFCPKISDFGLAKLCSKEQSIVSMTAARGTAGYIAPEVCSRNSGNVSYKSDVYSFGMLLLEMVGGRKNTDATVENTSQVYFPEWIYNRLYQGEEFGLHIIEENEEIIARKLTIVALWCIQWYPVDRPSMKSVVQMLEGSMENLVMPPNPFTSAGPPNTHVALSDRRLSTNLTTIPEPYSEQEEV